MIAGGDLELAPEKMHAFGEIDIWYGDATIGLNLPMDRVRVDQRGYKEHKREFYPELFRPNLT